MWDDPSGELYCLLEDLYYLLPADKRPSDRTSIWKIFSALENHIGELEAFDGNQRDLFRKSVRAEIMAEEYESIKKQIRREILNEIKAAEGKI